MNQDFLDILHALSDAEARFLVVGAYAVGVHGHPRATGDLDLWVEASPENAPRIWKALRAFGAPLHQVSESEFATSGIVFQIGVVPRRIDLLTEITGVDFATAWSHRTVAMFGDLACPVLGREELLVNKRSTGRDKDLVDARALERLPPRT